MDRTAHARAAQAFEGASGMVKQCVLEINRPQTKTTLDHEDHTQDALRECRHCPESLTNTYRWTPEPVPGLRKRFKGPLEW